MIAHFTRRAIAAVLAPTCVVALAACTGGAKIEMVPSTSPTPSAMPSEPVEVFPQRGATAPLVEKNGKFSCDPDDATLHVEFGKTVDTNGTQVTATNDDGIVTISFSAENPAKESGVVNGTVPFLIPLEDNEILPGAIVLNPANFGEIKTIVLCGGGL